VTIDHFEDNLRAALARCAGDVPPHVVARIRQHEHTPAAPRRHLGAGLAVLGVATAAAAGFMLWTHTPSSSTQPAGALGEQTMRLADATISLPAGFARSEAACVATPAGLQLVGASFATAVSRSGGCITMFLATGATAPPDAQDVVIGGHPGALITDPSTGISTAYITIPADLYIEGSRDYVIENGSAEVDLVIASRGLSPAEMATITAAGIPDHPMSAG